MSHTCSRVIQQLRACGVLETIRISGAGYPSRWSYADFFERYRLLYDGYSTTTPDSTPTDETSANKTKKNRVYKPLDSSDLRKSAESIIVPLIPDTDKFQFGLTKIFFRAGQVAFLEKLRADKTRISAIAIQASVRGWIQRRKYVTIRLAVLGLQTYGRGKVARLLARSLIETRSAIKIQAHYKGFCARKEFNLKMKVIVSIQSWVRGRKARALYQELKREKSAVVLQAWYRGNTERRMYQRKLRAIVVFQCAWRCMTAKRELKTLKIEAKSVAGLKEKTFGLENKIIELQRKLNTQHETSNNAHALELKETQSRLSEMSMLKGRTRSRVAD